MLRVFWWRWAIFLEFVYEGVRKEGPENMLLLRTRIHVAKDGRFFFFGQKFPDVKRKLGWLLPTLMRSTIIDHYAASWLQTKWSGQRKKFLMLGLLSLRLAESFSPWYLLERTRSEGKAQ